MEKKKISLLGGRTMLSCVVMGVVVSAVVSALLLMGLTYLAVGGVVPEGKTSVFIFAIRVLATLTGCIVGSGLTRERAVPIVGFITLGYFLIIFALGVIAYDGASHIGSGLISVLSGGVIACAIKLKSQMNKGRAVRRRK
ncbi:MAG: hypothetical protein E7421_04955 [Ruminococcaceae bacterium]|nr:hypothetical protein [Oscillospiraceae bacterium]